MKLTPKTRIELGRHILETCRRWTFAALLAVGAGGMLPGWPAAARAESATATGTAAHPQRIAVLYPNIGEPYGSVFVSITKGIEAELAAAPVVIPVAEDAEAVRAQLAAGGFDACIALGRTTLDLLDSLQLDIPVVRGAVLDPNVPIADPGAGAGAPLGISLTPDPAQLLGHLKSLAPTVNRVTVVYSDVQSQALIDRAVAAGGRLGLAVTAHRAEDLSAAAATYKSVIATLGPGDALWLPQDPQAVDDKVILPMLLNAAWKQNFILFSSNADHAKRGALYSVYPDNVAMGRRLARLAVLRAASPGVAGGMQPLEDLLIAVNLRTAEHLRLNLDPSRVRTFDLTFPQR
ncbi:MAG: ABC transporter substrate-binding protein [Gammaproteobacteria bacterium]